MLDYIKSQISARQAANKPAAPTVDDVPDEAILEYATLFQELADLSMEGNDTSTRRMALDIPIEDDVEVTTVEFDLATGVVDDVPGDATVIESAYQGMKTFDKFYEEAFNSLTRMPRETNSAFDARVTAKANEMYTEYCNDAKEYGYFGFGSIDVKDERVPETLKVDFGPIRSDETNSFICKVPVSYAVDEKRNITKKQLDSINLVRGGAFKHIGPSLAAYMESTYTIPEAVSLWDAVTPTKLWVPKGNGDSFCVVLEFTNELTGKQEFFGWTRPVYTEAKKENAAPSDENNITMESCVEINMNSYANENNWCTRSEAIKIEEAMANDNSKKIPMRAINRFQRVYQEAIDFGGAESTATPDAGATNPPAMDNTANSDTNVDAGANTDANATPDATATDAGAATPAQPDGGDANGTDTTGDANKETAAVNDVSSQIADKVADDTVNAATNAAGGNMDPNTGAEEGETITFDDGTNNSVPVGSDTGDDFGASVDDQLDELNNTGNDLASDTDDNSDVDFSGINDDGSIDLDNMTIDQLIEQGSEKLKQMPLGEIKKFLASDDPGAVQEAVIITSGNVNKGLEVSIRQCLGILNSNLKFNDIAKNFSHAGKKLYKYAYKASKMEKIFDGEERTKLANLGKATGDLLNTFSRKGVAMYKKNPSAFGAVVKVFTDAANEVSSFVSQKIDKNVQESALIVQEGLFLSASNAKSRLARKASFVHADMDAIIKADEGGYLTKGKLSKMYKPKTESRKTTVGADSDFVKSSRSSDVEVNTPHSNYLSDLTRIANKILRKDKVQKAFTREEIGNISDMLDNIDDFVDMVEAIIYDNTSVNNDSIIKKIVEEAKKILENINTILESAGMSTATTSGENTTEDTATFEDNSVQTDVDGDGDVDSAISAEDEAAETLSEEDNKSEDDTADTDNTTSVDNETPSDDDMTDDTATDLPDEDSGDDATADTSTADDSDASVEEDETETFDDDEEKETEDE